MYSIQTKNNPPKYPVGTLFAGARGELILITGYGGDFYRCMRLYKGSVNRFAFFFSVLDDGISEYEVVSVP